jgi:DNA-binding Xre family transcriptional regulator
MHYVRLKALMAEWEAGHKQRLTVQQVAAATKIAPQTLSNMSRPSGYVSNTRYVESLCRFFGVTPNELFVFDPPIMRPRAPAPHRKKSAKP